MFDLTCNPSLTVLSAKGELVETDKVKLPNGSFALGRTGRTISRGQDITHRRQGQNFLAATQFGVGKHL